eukprot:10428919-Lingulodinium_polyedra.AAC.1
MRRHCAAAGVTSLANSGSEDGPDKREERPDGFNEPRRRGRLAGEGTKAPTVTGDLAVWNR